MTKYLVTGGFGFVGNEVVRRLRRNGFEVVIVDNLSKPAEDVADISDVRLWQVNIEDPDSIELVFQQENPDYVIHLAAMHYIPECNEKPRQTLRTNVEGTQCLLSAAEKHRVKHFVFASSGAIYADSAESLCENATAVAPVDIYGYSKYFCEQIGELISRNSILPVTAARLFNVYGPRETNPHFIPEILNQLKTSDILELGNIDTQRDFIYVEDAAEAFIRLSESNPRYFNIVNIGTGKAYTMRQVIGEIARLLGREITIKTDPRRIRKVDKQTQVADVLKSHRLTGDLRPRGLTSGLQLLLRYEGLINA